MQKLTGQYKNGRNELTNTHAGDPKYAAFFDVDRTLIKGDSQELEARFIIKNSTFGFKNYSQTFFFLTNRHFEGQFA